MAKKYYAVKQGRSTGVFDTWAQCKAQVDGYSGASYKSFATMEEARAFVQGAVSEPAQTDADAAVAYVDGSYRHDTREFSCGAVLFYKGEEKTFSQKFDDPQLADMRNVAGEIMGAATVLRYCAAQNIPRLVIYHDYEGVAKWATGEWKAGKPGTLAYKQLCADMRGHLAFSFIKVKGHSGDKYNDMADQLAKAALGLS